MWTMTLCITIPPMLFVLTAVKDKVEENKSDVTSILLVWMIVVNLFTMVILRLQWFEPLEVFPYSLLGLGYCLLYAVFAKQKLKRYEIAKIPIENKLIIIVLVVNMVVYGKAFI